MKNTNTYQVEVHVCQLVNVHAANKKDAIKNVLRGFGDIIDSGFDFVVCGGTKAVRMTDED